MDMDDLIMADCSQAKDYITVAEITAINVMVTEPELFDEIVEYEEGYKESLLGIIDSASDASNEYSDSHSEDYFEIHQIGVLQNLFEAEFRYLCRQNTDILYLSAVLMHRIASGHPYREGNKRTAYLASTIFLMRHQHKMGLQTVAIPELDNALLESLEDIAINSESLSAISLAKVYRKSMENEIKDIIT